MRSFFGVIIPTQMDCVGEVPMFLFSGEEQKVIRAKKSVFFIVKRG